MHSIADPGLTDALEFEDGKVMVGKHHSLNEVNWENIVSTIRVKSCKRDSRRPTWSALSTGPCYTAASDIWEAIQREIAPALNGERRLLFIDLADPEKRTRTDIRHALELIGRFQQFFEVILGLNEKESAEIGRTLQLDVSDHSPTGLRKLSEAIRAALGVNTVVVHPVKFAVAANAQATDEAEGPFTPQPLITTGAGDHFNAGFCLGRSLGLNNEQSLWTGVTASGFYVRHAKSPGIPDLVEMLRNWPGEKPHTQRERP